MACVQVAHRRHQPDARSAASRVVDRVPHRRDGGDAPHGRPSRTSRRHCSAITRYASRSDCVERREVPLDRWRDPHERRDRSARRSGRARRRCRRWLGRGPGRRRGRGPRSLPPARPVRAGRRDGWRRSPRLRGRRRASSSGTSMARPAERVDDLTRHRVTGDGEGRAASEAPSRRPRRSGSATRGCTARAARLRRQHLQPVRARRRGPRRRRRARCAPRSLDVLVRHTDQHQIDVVGRRGHRRIPAGDGLDLPADVAGALPRTNPRLARDPRPARAVIPQAATSPMAEAAPPQARFASSAAHLGSPCQSRGSTGHTRPSARSRSRCGDQVRREVAQRREDEACAPSSAGAGSSGSARSAPPRPSRRCRRRGSSDPTARHGHGRRPTRSGGTAGGAPSVRARCRARRRMFRYGPCCGPPTGSVSYSGDTATTSGRESMASRRCARRSPRFDPRLRKVRIEVGAVRASTGSNVTPALARSWGTGGRSFRTVTVTASILASIEHRRRDLVRHGFHEAMVPDRGLDHTIDHRAVVDGVVEIVAGSGGREVDGHVEVDLERLRRVRPPRAAPRTAP